MPFVRLSRISCLRSGVHFLSPMPAPGKVHDRVDALETRRVDGAGLGIPAHVVGPLGCAAHQADDAMAVGPQSRDERRADESVGSGHEHVHADHRNAASLRRFGSVVLPD